VPDSPFGDTLYSDRMLAERWFCCPRGTGIASIRPQHGQGSPGKDCAAGTIGGGIAIAFRGFASATTGYLLMAIPFAISIVLVMGLP
jgi:hypothetical protein